MSQTSVNDQGIARVGQKYALLSDRVLSYAAEAAVPFGRFCSLGTDKDLQAKLPSLATDITSIKAKRGAAVHSHALESVVDGLEPGYLAKSIMSLMVLGGMFVETEEVVTPESDVYVRFAGKKQVQTIVFDADLVAANAINGDVGAISLSETIFAADHVTTMGVIAAKILAENLFVESAVVGGGGNRTITITTGLDQADQDAANFAVTLGASQAGVVETETIEAVNSDKRGLYRTDADSASAAALANARFLRGSEVVDGKNIAVLELL